MNKRLHLKFKKMSPTLWMTSVMVFVLAVGLVAVLGEMRDTVGADKYYSNNQVILDKLSSMDQKLDQIVSTSKQNSVEMMLLQNARTATLPTQECNTNYAFESPFQQDSNRHMQMLNFLKIDAKVVCTPTPNLASKLVCEDDFYSGKKTLEDVAKFVCQLLNTPQDQCDVNTMIQDACKTMGISDCSADTIRTNIPKFRKGFDIYGDDMVQLVSKYDIQVVPTIVFNCKYRRAGVFNTDQREVYELSLAKCLISKKDVNACILG